MFNYKKHLTDYDLQGSMLDASKKLDYYDQIYSEADYSVRKKLRRHFFSPIHPVFMLPGWVVRNLTKSQRREMIGPDVQEVTHTSYSTETCVLFNTGVEVRLTPTPLGLSITWWYHLPTGVKKMTDYLSHQTVFSGSIECDQMIAWGSMERDDKASAHQRIENLSNIAMIPKERSQLQRVYVHVDGIDSMVVDYPMCKLLIFDHVGQDEILVASAPKDRPIRTFLTVDYHELSRLPYTITSRASRLLQRQIPDMPLKKRIEVVLLNFVAFCIFTNRKFLSFFRKISSKFLNKKEQTPT